MNQSPHTVEFVLFGTWLCLGFQTASGPDRSPLQDSATLKWEDKNLWKSTKSGTELVYVAKGWFTMGGHGPDNSPVRRIYLDAFMIGKFDVTVAEFAKYCRDTGYRYDWNGRKPKWGWVNNHPMVCVTWDEANAFCRWAGGNLPTEAQWEKAARGTHGRKYPWGNHYDLNRLWSSRLYDGDAGSSAPVGSFPRGASPYGCLDMAGNVWQWCSDWYGDGYRGIPNRNPLGVGFGTKHVLRGGSWVGSTSDFYVSSARNSHETSVWDSSYGFRLARKP